MANNAQLIRDLQTQMEQLMAESQRQQALIASLQSTAPQVTPPITTRKKEVAQPAAPDVFYGDSDKVEEFTRQIYSYLTPYVDMTEIERVQFAFSFMRGPVAGTWAARQQQKLIEYERYCEGEQDSDGTRIPRTEEQK